MITPRWCLSWLPKPKRMNAFASNPQIIEWQVAEQSFSAVWHSEAGVIAPQKIMAVDDSLSADQAYQLASQGNDLLWLGDFHQAKQVLSAMARRHDKKMQAGKKTPITTTSKAKSVKPSNQANILGHAKVLSAEDFHRYRMAQAQRARILGRILIPLQADNIIPLRRAPDVALACTQVLDPSDTMRVLSLREMLSIIAAFEWRKKGVWLEPLQARVYPHYGVFSPVRGEYLSLLAKAPLHKIDSAWDIGTGTGVISALLAQRGIKQIIATDNDPRALSCAQENLAHMGISTVQLEIADLFPNSKQPADLIVCNPPWLPAKPSAPIERAVYDQDSQMLTSFLSGVGTHLSSGGEAWLIMSNLAELLGLREPGLLLEWISQAGLYVIDKMDIQPQHGKAFDRSDALYLARVKEVTSLYRLGRTK